MIQLITKLLIHSQNIRQDVDHYILPTWGTEWFKVEPFGFGSLLMCAWPWTHETHLLTITLKQLVLTVIRNALYLYLYTFVQHNVNEFYIV